MPFSEEDKQAAHLPHMG